MEELKRKIVAEGTAISGGIVKVDSFLNHQIDSKLMYNVAKEFVERFSDVEYDKIITIEASGIAPAVFLGLIMDKPVLFAKKARPKTIDDFYMSDIYSFTKKETKSVIISREFLHKGDRILFIDDFLANGDAAVGINNIVHFAEAELVGMGFVIEKSFQPGAIKLREMGIRVESLARVSSTENGKFEFKD